MSITTQIKREYKKISRQVETGQSRMRALECVMRKYQVWQYPYAEAISDLVIEFMINHGGKATFSSIAAMLEDKDIEIPHQKLSLVLNRNPRLYYNRQSQEWEVWEPVKEGAA